MKYYEQLIDLGCFTVDDVADLSGNRETAYSIIKAYKKKGLIENVKRDLWVAMSLETKRPVPNRYAIGSHASPGAYIAYHSALEYHGIANQVYYEVYAASVSRFRTFEHDGLTYTHVQTSTDVGVVDKPGGVRVTDLERTVLDGINDFSKVGGLEELLRSIALIPLLDGNKLIEYLATYDKVFLFQKAGYVLEHFKESLKLNDGFFNACKTGITGSKRYLYPSLQNESSTYHAGWALCVPRDLSAITRKGATYIE